MKEFPTKKKYTRRDALVGSFLVVGSAAANEVETSKSITPTQIEGPFYPDMDNNLTKVMGSKKNQLVKRLEPYFYLLLTYKTRWQHLLH